MVITTLTSRLSNKTLGFDNNQEISTWDKTERRVYKVIKVRIDFSLINLMEIIWPLGGVTRQDD